MEYHRYPTFCRSAEICAACVSDIFYSLFGTFKILEQIIIGQIKYACLSRTGIRTQEWIRRYFLYALNIFVYTNVILRGHLHCVVTTRDEFLP